MKGHRWLTVALIATIAAVLMVAVCGTARKLPTSAAALTSAINARGCYDPAAYGATPDDNGPDGAAIQAAIDAAGKAGGGEVCLGAGRWKLDRAPRGSFDRFAGLTIHYPHVTLRGAGNEATTLYVEGSQKHGTFWIVTLEGGAGDNAVSDLAIDSSGALDTDEQTHAIEIKGPVDTVSISHIRFNQPRPADGSRSGD